MATATMIRAPDSPPTPNSATLFGQVTVEGEVATGLDWIGAFGSNGQCAGSTSLFMYEGLAYINLTIYGDDATTFDVIEGISADGLFALKFYDQSTGATLEYNGGVLLSGWFNTNGAPLPGYNNPQTLYDFGYPLCGDETACNYDPNSTSNDGCEYAEEGYQCDGTCVADEDEDGVCDLFDPCVGIVDDRVQHRAPFTTADATTPRRRMRLPRQWLDALFTCGGDCEADEDGATSATTRTIAWVNTRVQHLQRPGCGLRGDCSGFLLETVTAMATNSTLWACAVEIVRTPMPMAR